MRQKSKITCKTHTLLSIIALIALLTACGRTAAPETDAPAAEAVSESAQTSVTSPSETSLTITALKGGAADSFVLKTPNHTVIIDTGLDKNGDELVESLKEQGITMIDELIITHFDKDHVGGADHFPQPEGPRRVMKSPSSIVRLMSLRT